MPMELEAAYRIQHYGAEAVFGRPLGYGEMRRMTLAENIVADFEARRKSGNWVSWEIEHPDEADLLKECERLASDAG